MKQSNLIKLARDIKIERDNSFGEIPVLFTENLCSRLDLIDSHIEKHGLEIGHEQYFEIGQRVSAGEQGVHVGWFGGRWYTVVIKGTKTVSDRSVGILRSVRGSKAPDTCYSYGAVPYSHECCFFSELNYESGEHEGGS